MKIVRENPICDPARAESPTSPKPRATPWVPCSPFVRPVRAKVSINTAPKLLPLQGVGIYALIPRALPWAMHLLPFQGAPFRALFVYHVRMLRHLLFGSKPRKLFLDFNHPHLRAQSGSGFSISGQSYNLLFTSTILKGIL